MPLAIWLWLRCSEGWEQLMRTRFLSVRSHWNIRSCLLGLKTNFICSNIAVTTWPFLDLCYTWLLFMNTDKHIILFIVFITPSQLCPIPVVCRTSTLLLVQSLDKWKAHLTAEADTAVCWKCVPPRPESEPTFLPIVSLPCPGNGELGCSRRLTRSSPYRLWWTTSSHNRAGGTIPSGDKCKCKKKRWMQRRKNGNKKIF